MNDGEYSAEMLLQHLAIHWNRVEAWGEMSDSGLRLRCGELTAQEIRTVRAVLNAILANAADEIRAAEPVPCEDCGKPAVRLTDDGVNLCCECYALCPEDTQNNAEGETCRTSAPNSP